MKSIALLVLTASLSLADVKLPALFSDNAVLQRGATVNVWGIADPGESVTVSIAGEKADAKADSTGRWLVQLPALKAGGPYEMTVSGHNTLTLHNLAVGEVWVASGQSNMQFPLSTWSKAGTPYFQQASKDLQVVNDPQIRMFTVPDKTADQPQDNVTAVTGQWLSANPQDAAKFSAVAYYFARGLREKLNVPVGIIHSSWGGTPAEAWTSRPALEADPELKKMLTEWDKKLANYPAEKKKYDEITLPQWKQDAEKAKTAGQPEPRKPRPPYDAATPQRPANIFNQMIAPLMPYTIKGVIWYQGEANGSRGPQYRKLFPALITDWRARWKQGNFPFLYVQLANFLAPQTQPIDGEWPFLREAQLMTLSLPHTGMAVAIDQADREHADDIHPHDKKDVGHRLALIALSQEYGENVGEYSGPIFSAMKVDGKEARLSFTHLGGGLLAKGDKLSGFALAGSDKKFVWAEARIDGDTIVVSSPEVAQPTAVRYDWASNPIGNLYNKENLPASPFRTDPDSAH